MMNLKNLRHNHHFVTYSTYKSATLDVELRSGLPLINDISRGEAVVQITAAEITIDHLLVIWPPESVLYGETLFIDPDKGLKIVLHAAVIIG